VVGGGHGDAALPGGAALANGGVIDMTAAHLRSVQPCTCAGVGVRVYGGVVRMRGSVRGVHAARLAAIRSWSGTLAALWRPGWQTQR
jgi:hypothetical protein